MVEMLIEEQNTLKEKISEQEKLIEGKLGSRGEDSGQSTARRESSEDFRRSSSKDFKIRRKLSKKLI